MATLEFTRRYAMAHRLLATKSAKCAIPHGHNEFVTVRLEPEAREFRRLARSREHLGVEAGDPQPAVGAARRTVGCRRGGGQREPDGAGDDPLARSRGSALSLTVTRPGR